MTIECADCGLEMKHHDYLYTGNHTAYEKGYADSGYKIVADVYQCENEECPNFQNKVTINR